MAYYVLDANKNLKEALDKEGVYAVLEQAIEDGDLEHVDADSAFVSKIKDLNGGQDFKVWIGTTAEYNAIQEKTQNTLYLITDDTLDQELSDMEQQINTLQTSVDNLAVEHADFKYDAFKVEIKTFTKLSDFLDFIYDNYKKVISATLQFSSAQTFSLIYKDGSETSAGTVTISSGTCYVTSNFYRTNDGSFESRGVNITPRLLNMDQLTIAKTVTDLPSVSFVRDYSGIKAYFEQAAKFVQINPLSVTWTGNEAGVFTVTHLADYN